MYRPVPSADLLNVDGGIQRDTQEGSDANNVQI